LELGTMDNTTAIVVKFNWSLDFLTDSEIQGKKLFLWCFFDCFFVSLSLSLSPLFSLPFSFSFSLPFSFLSLTFFVFLFSFLGQVNQSRRSATNAEADKKARIENLIDNEKLGMLFLFHSN